MNIVYVSVQCSEPFLRKHFDKSSYIPGQQAQKYNRLLAEGFAMINNINVYHVTQVPAYNKSIPGLFRIFAKECTNGINYYYLPILNIKKIQDILNIITSFFLTFFLCLKNRVKFVIMDVLSAPSALGAICAAKLLRRKSVGIVTDVPDILFDTGEDVFYHYFSNKVIEKCDSFILLTEQMNEIMNPKNRPYVIIEGMVDINQKNFFAPRTPNLDNKKIILYTGTINKQYGIKNLIEGFIDAKLPDVELHIYGDGDYKDELLEKCNNYENIKYYGTILNEKITEKQKNAFLLINPRSSEGEYTKYSFPSKNMEYMVSGRPVLLKILPGMPEEYGKYVIKLDRADKEDIKEKITAAYNMTNLQELGEKAREFVLKEKNNKIQAEKVIKFMRSL